MRTLTWFLWALLLLLAACQSPAVPPLAVAPVIEPVPATLAAATATLPATAVLPLTHTPPPTSTPLMPTATPTPFYSGERSPACGQILPLVAAGSPPATTALDPDPEALAALRERMPATAVPALERILARPDTVGLAVYRAGAEADGVFINPDMAMPLASVVKVVHLVAYAEAVSAGRLDPLAAVAVADLEAYYLPGYDLGAHNRSLADLAERERIFGQPPHLSLNEIPRMMMRYSSNAAADYLHRLLGQAAIEETAVSLGLSQQTAPCTWLGQFMAMANHTSRASNDRAALEAYLADPTVYGREASLLTDAYVTDAAFREAERAFHSQTRRPSFDTQYTFAQALNAQGSAREYAALMARLAQNGLSHPDSSYLARTYLEWPMIFPDNQVLFSNLGYKNGSLPGILTTVYYAYPRGEVTPIVLALFYRDLPDRTYREWRRSLPHDELARWLLSDPEAIPHLRAVLRP